MLKYAVQRFLIMIPMLILISIICFILIELPPGDYVSNYIDNLQRSGVQVSQDEAVRLRAYYGLGDPAYTRYLKWVKNVVIRGDIGISFQQGRPNSVLIAERLPRTMFFAFVSLLLSWGIAIPIGIYSATHQYSLLDYVFTFIGFFGVGTPAFLIAMVLAWAAYSYFGFSALGLSSIGMLDAPLSWAKLLDYAKHMIIPMSLLVLTGTAGMIRTMRNNLLDELRKPYVVTARAKGLARWQLVLKYPVRLALNPVIVSTAGILPGLFAGEALMSIVLGLDTIGPLLLTSIRVQDMYLAGTLLTILAALTLIGNFVSDVLLAVVDPRIRLGGGVSK